MGLAAIQGPAFSGFQQLQNTRQINTNLGASSLSNLTAASSIANPPVENSGNVQTLIGLGVNLDVTA